LYNTTTDRLSVKFTEQNQAAQDMVDFTIDASNSLLIAIENGPMNSNMVPECCGGDANLCCHRCEDFDLTGEPNLQTKVANVADSLSQSMSSLMDSYDDNVQLEFGFSQSFLIHTPRPSGRCVALDSRAQPWYTFAISKPRTISILIDLSFGLSLPDKEQLKISAKNLLYSLNPKDRVNLVLFGASSVSPPNCYQFVSATADNVQNLSNFMDQYQELLGSANTSYFLQQAVENVKNNKHSTEGLVVLFTSVASLKLTSSILTTVKSNEDIIQFSFVYYEGADIPPTLSENDNFKSFNMKDDAYSYISHQLKLQDTSASKLEWLVTIDRQTGERYISITKPLVTYDVLHGVFHGRLKISALTSTFSNYFSVKPVSYYFVTDVAGEVIYHPSGGKGAARSISEIERVPQLQLSVNETMDFSATKVVSLALGPSESDGILNKELTFHYTCRQLFTGMQHESPPVVCAVMESSEAEEAVFSPVSGSLSNVAEHRYIPQEGSCDFFTYQANTGFSSVTLSESMVPVSAATGDVNNFIRNGRTLSDIQNSVRVDASVASRLTESWGEQNANTDSVTWRYFGSYQGLYATYPAVTLPKDYKPTHSSWYRTGSVPSMETGTTRFIPAQRDPFGSGYIYGISKKIQGNLTYGVAGAHISLGSLLSNIEENLPMCSTFECSLFDDAGNVVYHSDFAEALPDRVTSLAKMSRFLSHALNGKLRTTDFCLDYANVGVIDRHFYNYELINRKVDNLNESSCPAFIAKRVPGTNVIFVVANRESCTLLCPCRDECASGTCPVYRNSHLCQCRCKCRDQDPTEYCSVSDNSGRLKGASVCPSLMTASPQYKPVKYATSLSRCQSTDCGAIKNNLTCVSSPTCLQCGSSCFRYSACCSSSPYTSGITACTNPTTQSTPLIEPNIVAIVVPVVIIILLIILILLALIIWYNIRIKGKGEQEHHTNVFDFSKDKKTNKDANGEEGNNNTTDIAKEKEAEAELDKVKPKENDYEEAEITEQTLQNDTPI
jgi:hypothetical protein